MLHLTNLEELKLSNHLWDIDEETDCELCIEYGCVCEIHSEIEWDAVMEDIHEVARELNERGWDFISCGGYMGWNSRAGNSGIKEVTGENLKSLFFPYSYETDISLDFTEIDKGIFTAKIFHHDRPTGETVYYVKENDLDSEDEWTNPTEHCIDIAREKGIL